MGPPVKAGQEKTTDSLEMHNNIHILYKYLSQSILTCTLSKISVIICHDSMTLLIIFVYDVFKCNTKQMFKSILCMSDHDGYSKT